MALESIENQKVAMVNNKSPTKNRVISQSTGLAKFNITQKIQQRDHLNEDFENLEKKAKNNEELKAVRSGLNISSTVSPKKSSNSSSKSSSPKKETHIGMINDQLMLELASKQREVLELKSQLDQLKKKLSTSEKELWEIEKKCNRSTASTLPPALSPIKRRPAPAAASTQAPPRRQGVGAFKAPNVEPTLRSKPSLSTIKASIEATATTQSQNFEKLKKKISINQLNSKPSLNFKNFQKDSSMFWEKSLNAFSSFKTDFMKERHDDEDFDSASDVSDYGCADTSDYQLAVK